MPTDSFTRALDELDPILRALVELSLRQGLDDAEIAGMLGRETDDVAAEREAVLRDLARQVAPHAKNYDLPELEAVIAQAIPSLSGAPAPKPYEGEDRRETDKLGAYVVPAEIDDTRARPALHVVPEPEPEAAEPDWITHPRYEAPDQHRREPSRSRQKILAGVLAIVLALAVVVAFQRSDDGSGNGSTAAPGAQPATPAPAAAEPVTLTPLPGAPKDIKGSATISDGTLELNVTGLPEGSYGVWLYNSLIDSKPVATGKGPELDVDTKLPADADKYEFIDVSLEPADGNPNHSGESVLRIPVTRASR